MDSTVWSQIAPQKACYRTSMARAWRVSELMVLSHIQIAREHMINRVKEEIGLPKLVEPQLRCSV